MEILEEFKERQIIFSDLKNRIEGLVISLVKSNNINIHQYSTRIKDIDSLRKKIERKKGKYKKLNDITDILGCRLITYFEDDVDKIASIIETEFNVDWDNTVDKRKIDIDKFGYLSLHYIVQLKNDRLRLTEYKNFKGFKFEIQIRSILQHSWAEIEHDIGYKGKFSIPDTAKRSFSRIAALLEIADDEFIRLRNVLNEYESNVSSEIKNSPETTKIDNATLAFILKNDDSIKKLDQRIADMLNIDLEFNEDFISDLSYKLNMAGIHTIKEYKNVAKNDFDNIIKFSNYFRFIENKNNETNSRGQGVVGLSIFDLTAYFVFKYRDEKTQKKFFEHDKIYLRYKKQYEKFLKS